MSIRTFHKLSLGLVAFGITMNTYAVAPGFYLGLMGGPATNSASDVQAQSVPNTNPPVTTTVHSKSNQFGSRLYMGYKVNKYFGFEGGIAYYSTIKFVTNNSAATTCGGTNVRVRDFDFVGKGGTSLGRSGVDVFARAGVAVVYQTVSAAMNPQGNQYCGESKYTNKFSPTYGIGASYDFTQNWVGDISWTRTQAGGVAKNVDLYALGLSYHFVDYFCGQFLC